MHASRFRLAFLLFGLLALTLGAPLLPRQYLISQNLNQPDDSILRMKQALATSAVHPAILIGGGSNVLTGIRAAAVSNALNLPVYNLGLSNEGGDFRNSIALLEGAAKAGDTVVYSSRGFHVGAPFIPNKSATDVGTVPGQFKLAERSLLGLLVLDMPDRPWDQADNFNAHGDFTRCLPAKDQLEPLFFYQPGTSERARFLKEITGFAQRMKARGVRIVFLAPHLLVRAADLPKWTQHYEKLQSERRLLGPDWLSQAATDIFVTDPTEFCDTPFHPNTKHAIMNSKKLAQQLTVQN